jgi:uncharacterized membrane protein
MLMTLTWRILAETDTFLITYLITGSFFWSISIIGVESATKTVLYYLHDRAWGHVLWGVQVPDELIQKKINTETPVNPQ